MPFTETMKTTTLMMTPPVMELYAFLDTYQVDDNALITDTFKQDYPGVNIMQGSAYINVSLSAAADPTSPNFMQWYDPDPANLSLHRERRSAVQRHRSHRLLPGQLLHAAVDPLRRRRQPPAARATASSAAPRRRRSFGQFTLDDFGESAWRMVTITTPTPASRPRSSATSPRCARRTSSYLQTPHPGFFSTPAFFANWPTNQSNQMRVTANQALIVGTGHAGRRHRHDDAAPGGRARRRARREPRPAGDGVLRLPPAPRPDAGDPLQRLDLLVLPAAGPGDDRPEGAVRLRGRRRSRSSASPTSAPPWRRTPTSPRPGCRSSATTPTRGRA